MMPFKFTETHGITRQPGNRLLASSDGAGWRSLYASAQIEAPFDHAFAPVCDHLVVMHLGGPVRVARLLAGRWEERMVPPGGLCILPAGADFRVRLDAALDSVHLYLRHELLEETAAALFGDSRADGIAALLGVFDPLLEQLAREVRGMLLRPEPSDPLYVEALAHAMAARLLRSHRPGRRPAPAARKDTLTPGQLARSREHVEANLDGKLSLGAIARAAGLSPVHFARRFKATTGEAPYQHVVRARVERAKRLLSVTDHSLAEIALRCGFSHQQHMTRVVRRVSGLTPGAWRRGA